MSINVSKKDPVAYGEYLIKRISESNVSQTKLASILGENRTELGRYVKIGKWSNLTKEFVINNREKITNTVIIKAARDFTNESEALEFMKKYCESKDTLKQDTKNKYSKVVRPIPSQHMLESLIKENKLLMDQVNSLKEVISQHNEQFSDLQKCIDQLKNKTDSEEKEGDVTQKKCIKKSFVRYISRCANNLRLNIMILSFWIFIVPVTALFIENCLNSFNLQNIAYFKDVPISYLALLLAVTLDLLIFNLLNRMDAKSQLLAYLLVGLNSAGAFFISGKNSQLTLITEVKAEKSKIKEEIDKLQVKVAHQKTEYLATKWPNQSNPFLCEKQAIQCGLPYTSRAQEALKIYLSSSDLLTTKKDMLKSLDSKPLPRESSNDIYWHIGYYVVIWALLLITVWLKKADRAYCTI